MTSKIIYNDGVFRVFVDIVNRDCNNFVVTFNYFYPEFEPITVADREKSYVWGDGAYSKKGINQINVETRCCNYFISDKLDIIINAIKSNIERDAKILCIGTSMGGFGAIVFAQKLGGDFIAFSPQYDEMISYGVKKFLHGIDSNKGADTLFKKINNYLPSLSFDGKKYNSYVIYDPYAKDEGIFLDAKAALNISEKFGCNLVPIPSALHSCVEFINRHIGLVNIAEKYFLSGNIKGMFYKIRKSNVERKIKIAIVCSSNAIIKNNFVKFIPNYFDAEIKSFSIGDAGIASAILTIIQNNILNEFDICIFDQFLNDLIFLERKEVEDEYVYGSWYALISLFSQGVRCKPLAILHCPKHIDIYNHGVSRMFVQYYGIPYIDVADMVMSFSDSIEYEDMSHYGIVFQKKLAAIIGSHIKLLKYKGFDGLSFSLGSGRLFAKDKFISIRGTSLLKTNIHSIQNNECLQFEFNGKKFIEGVEFWSDDNSGYFNLNTKNIIYRKNFKKKFNNKVAFEPLCDIEVINGFSVDVKNVKYDKLLICHNGLPVALDNSNVRLDLVDFLISDINFTELGRIVKLNFLGRSILPDDASSLFIVKKELFKSKTLIEKILYIQSAIEINKTNEAELLDILGDVYKEYKDYKRAAEAYENAIRIAGISDKIACKLSAVLLFNLNDYVKAEVFLNKITDNKNSINNFWVYRHKFVIYKMLNDKFKALFYALRTIECKQNVYENWWKESAEYLVKNGMRDRVVKNLGNCPSAFVSKITRLIE